MAKAIEQGEVGLERAQPVSPHAPPQPTAELVLRELGMTLSGLYPERGAIQPELVRLVRAISDPCRVRAFLDRCVMRVANFVIADPLYGPQVRRCLELGIAATLLPEHHSLPFGEAAWAALSSCLVEQCGLPQAPTPARTQANRAAVVTAALAASLRTDELEDADLWIQEAVFACFLLVSDASKPTRSEPDFELLRVAFFQDLERLAASPRQAISPWVDGPLGGFWPGGVPSGLKEPDLAELRRWSDELTKSTERTNLDRMEGRESRGVRRTSEPGQPVVEAGQNPLDTGVTPDETGGEQRRVRLRSPHALEELRQRMRDAVQHSNLSLDEIGILMGIGPDKHPKAAVNKLMRRSPDPGIFMLLRFSKAVGVPLSQLLPESMDPTH